MKFVTLILATIVVAVCSNAERYYIKSGVVHRSSGGDDLEDIIEKQLKELNIKPDRKLKEVYPELMHEEHFPMAEQMVVNEGVAEIRKRAVSCFNRMDGSETSINLFTATIDDIVYDKFSFYEADHGFQVSHDEVSQFINQLKWLALSVSKCVVNGDSETSSVKPS